MFSHSLTAPFFLSSRISRLVWGLLSLMMTFSILPNRPKNSSMSLLWNSKVWPMDTRRMPRSCLTVRDSSFTIEMTSFWSFFSSEILRSRYRSSVLRGLSDESSELLELELRRR